MKQGEENHVADLILNIFSEFVAPDFSDDGVLEFKTFASKESIAKRLLSGDTFIVAEIEQQIIGVIEMRDNSHIALLFVEKAYQKKGVAKKLLFEAIRACKQKKPDIQNITVNSSPNAYAAYQAFGFKGENKVKTVNGIRFVPLELSLDH